MSYKEESSCWYIAKCPTGSEESSIKKLKENLAKAKCENLLVDYAVPYDDKTKRYSKKVMANYIFLNIIYNDQFEKALNQLKSLSLMLDDNLNFVTVEEEKIIEIKNSAAAKQKEEDSELKVGEKVKLTEPPFEDFTGSIESIDAEKKQVTVSVPILGRQISLELPFNSIKRIKE